MCVRIYRKKNVRKKILKVVSKKLTVEKADLLKWFTENTSIVDVEKTKRLKEVDEEIINAESNWFASQTKFEAFEKEMKIAKNGN